MNRQLVEDLQASEGKIAGNNRQKQKLEQTLDEVEEAVERERRGRAEIEKNKRKIESELKGMQENIDEMMNLKQVGEERCSGSGLGPHERGGWFDSLLREEQKRCLQGADAILKKKEAEMHALAVRMEDEKVRARIT